MSYWNSWIEYHHPNKNQELLINHIGKYLNIPVSKDCIKTKNIQAIVYFTNSNKIVLSDHVDTQQIDSFKDFIIEIINCQHNE